MTIPANTTELKRLAEAATPGEWRVAEDNNPFADGRHVFAKGFDGSDFVVLNLKTDQTFVTATSREQQQKNALFSAAANPEAVLSLISTIERQAEEIAALREGLEPFAATDVLEPNGVIVGLERWHFERARRLSHAKTKEGT